MRLLLFTIILFFTIFTAWGYFQTKPLNIVKVTNFSKGNIETDIRVTGKVINNKVIKIAALIDGKLESLVSLGTKVKKNKSLVKFNDQEQKLNLAVIKSEFNLQKIISNDKKQKFLKSQNLFKKKVISKDKFEESKQELLISQAQEKVLLEKINIRQMHLNRTNIQAPFSGTITNKNIDSGQWVELGSHILTLASTNGDRIESNIDISDLTKIKIGSKVIVQSDSYPEYTWKESIIKKSPITNNSSNNSNTFSINISLGKKAPLLLMNQQVDIKIPLKSKSNILKLPFDALINNSDGTKSVAILKKLPKKTLQEINSIQFKSLEIWCNIYTCNNEEKKIIQLKTITTGIEDFTHVEIIEGLEGNELIALPQNQSFSNGMTVQIQ